MRLAAAGFALAILALPASAGQFGPSQYPIKDMDGNSVSNFTLAAELSERLAGLGTVTVGNPKGDVTLTQFYDLNCPFCREAALDVDVLVRGDRQLKLVFVPFPVLSVDSIQGGRVEIAAAAMLTPAKFLELHRRIYAQRGLINAEKVFVSATGLGVDRQKLANAANSQATIDTLKKNSEFGIAARLIATPAYLIKGVVILGHPGLKSLRDAVAAVRACGKVVC